MRCPKFTLRQTTKVMRKVRLPKGITPQEFHRGTNVEREHADLTKCSILKSAMIAAAHYRERKDYYVRLAKYVEK